VASSRRPLPGLVVRRAGPQDWRTYRDLRLAALLDSPRAFWTMYADAATFVEADWRSRLEWPIWIADAAVSPDPVRPPAPVGLVGLWHAPETPGAGTAGEILLVQMWVASWVRGRGAADALLAAAVETARADGWGRVVLEVAEENLRAAGCYRRAGFVATGRRAVMPWDPAVVEVEMALDLHPDRPPTPSSA
jgi:ribosomal protein S18 acetylase RimI-like enzyme